MHSITYFNRTEEMVIDLLKKIKLEIENSKNLLYKPVIICPNNNFQNYITKFQADSSDGKISMGLELISIEQYLKKVLRPNEILVNEKILGLEILNIFQKNHDKYHNLRKIFEEKTLSRKNRFDLSFSLAYRMIQYQRELGSNWKDELSTDSSYGKEQVQLIEDIYISRNDTDTSYIFPEFLPKLILERRETIFKKPIHIVGPSNLLYIHIESLSNINKDIYFYQLHPYKNSPSKIQNPSSILGERFKFIEYKFEIKNSSIQNSKENLNSNLSYLQNKMMDNEYSGLDENDNTLQILISPSIKREVEAVYSDILLNLQKDSRLSPNDFLILVPNLDLYSTTIHSVFSMNNLDFSESGKKYHKIMSYIITDEAAGKKSSFALAIHDFFQMGLYGGLNRRNVSTLLRHTNIQIPLGIQPEDISRISNWFDKYSFLKSITPDEIGKGEIQREVHSFKYFLKKIRMGIFYPPTHEDTLTSVENVLFHPAGNPNREDLILLEKLHKAEKLWTEWIAICKEYFIDIEQLLNILEQNIMVDYSNQNEIFLYHKLKSKLLEVSRENYSLNPEELYLLIMNILENDKDTQETILENGVTISPILPVRPIPFKFVYILGLNKGSFGINPEKSPYDLFYGGSTSFHFHIINSRELAEIMLHEAIFSARTQLVFGMVIDESTDKIKEILNWFSKNQNYEKYLKLNEYYKINEKEIINNPVKKISEILSESGVVLGNLLEFLQTLPISIPLNFIPLSRYSRFYFQKDLHLPGSFINHEIDNQRIAATNLSSGNDDGSMDERDYLNLFHDNKDRNKNEDIEIQREIHSPLSLKTLIRFLLNPLDDFLFNINFNFDINPDPNEEFDPMELTSKDIAKLFIPKLKEGNQTQDSMLSYYKEQKEYWISRGMIPAGHWSISDEEELDLQNNLFKDLNFDLLKNPERLDFSIKLDGVDIYHKFTTYNNQIIKLSQYSKGYVENILLPDFFCDAISLIYLKTENHSKINLKYIYLDDNTLKTLDYKTLDDLITIKSKIQDLLVKLIIEYKKGSLPYSFEKIKWNEYIGGTTDISKLIDFKAEFNPNNSYEGVQRERKKKIFGDRNPIEIPIDYLKKRVLNLLSLNKDFRELFTNLKVSQKEPSVKKKATTKKKASKKKL